MKNNVMTEMDVREIVVRPFLQALGYEHFTNNNIRTEVNLRYPHTFLGRKKSSDPKLSGKADYVCEVISHGRWIVEAKASHADISRDDVEQAHSYAVHPEVRAIYFLVTNGKRFVVYSVNGPDQPVLEWTLESQAEHWVNIQNLLAPAAIVERSRLILPQPGKALGVGIGSNAKLVGGFLTYTYYEGQDEQIAAASQQFVGLRATVIGDGVERDGGGMIKAILRLAGPTPEWDRVNSLVGFDKFEFRTADEYLSNDAQRATVFQNMVNCTIPAHTKMFQIAGAPSPVIVPFPMQCSAFTQAAGYLDGTVMLGHFQIEYLIRMPKELGQFVKSTSIEMRCGGDFSIQLQ